MRLVVGRYHVRIQLFTLPTAQTVEIDQKNYTRSETNDDTERAIEAQIRFDEADAANVPGRKQIGLFSAIFIIFNRIIGTGYVEHVQLS